MKTLLLQLLLMYSLSLGLKHTVDITILSQPGCRGEEVITETVTEELVNETLQNVTRNVTSYPTYYNCSKSTWQNDTKNEGDPCDPTYCCDYPNSIKAIHSLVYDQIEINMASYLESYLANDSFKLGNFFTLGKDGDPTECLDLRKTRQSNATQSNEAPLFNSVVYFTSVQGRLIVVSRPSDGEWEFNQTYLNVTNKYTNEVIQSAFFKIKHQCNPNTDGSIIHPKQKNNVGYYFTAGIRGQQIKIEYEKGEVNCRKDQSQIKSYTWSFQQPNEYLQSNFTQNETHMIIEFVNQYQAQDWRQDWMPIAIDDKTGDRIYQSRSFAFLLECVADGTTYTAPPNQTDFEVGFPYSQTFQIDSGHSPQFIFKDPSSSLVVDHPDTNCLITTREIRYQDTNERVYDLVLSDQTVQSGGNFTIHYNGSKSEEINIKFKIRFQDKGGQIFWVEGLQFTVECGELSNNITSGPFVDPVYEEITANFYHTIQIIETGAGICLINEYNIIEATIEVFDTNDELVDTLTEQESEFTQVTQNRDVIQIYIKPHADIKRVYHFKVQGLVTGVVRHITEKITVTIKNSIYFEQPEDEIFVNGTGPYQYIIPKTLVKFSNPMIQVKSFSIKDIRMSIVNQDGLILPWTGDSEYNFQNFDNSSNPEEAILTFPSNCDYGRMYFFQLGAETTGTIEVYSDYIMVETYNNMSINASLQTPVTLVIDQYSEGHIYDLSQYLVLSQPGCIVQQMQVVEIFNPISQSYMSDQDVRSMMEFDEQNNLHLLNTQVQRQDLKIYVAATFSQDLIYSFDSFYLLDLFIEYVYTDKDIKTNIAPLFDTDPEDFHIEVESSPQNFTFLLPEIVDEDPSSVKFSITKGFNESFMTLGEREIKFDRFTRENQGNHSMQMRLTDSDGQFRNYGWTVIIDYLVQEEEQQINQEVEPETKIIKYHFAVEDWASQGVKEDETKDRKPIEIRVKDFSENGELTLIYSEELFPIEHFMEFGVNLTSLNQNIKNVLNLDYYCRKQEYSESTQDPDEKFPELIKYQIKEFTNHTLVLKLNFKNPLYVSSYGQKDLVSITFKANKLFTSIQDGFHLHSFYTLNQIKVPSQMASEQDFLKLSSIANSADKSLLLSLLVPLFFMVFMSASMERVWSFYNMLQLSVNLINYNTLHIPANHTFISQIIRNVAFFKLFQNEFVQLWLDKHIFGQAQALKKIIFDQGPEVTALIFCSVMLLISYLGLKVKALRSYALRLKNKMMWNSYLRGQIQMYFPTALMTLGTLKSYYGRPKPLQQEDQNQNEMFHSESGRLLEMVNYEWLEVEKNAYFSTFFKLAILVSLPIFSLFFLKKHKLHLQDPDFQAKYLSLYTGLKQRQRSVYKHTHYFTSRRLLLAFFTVYLNSYLIVNIYINFFSSLWAIKYLYRDNPFQHNLNNTFEKLNEIFNLFLCYSLIFYSNFIDDPELKYNIGWYFVYSFMFVGCFNISLITYDLILDVYRKTLKQSYQRRWQAHEAMAQKMARFIVYDAMKQTPELIKSKKEIQLYVLHIRSEYSITEMSDKIREIHEKAKDQTSPNDISIKDLPETQKGEYKRDDFEFKKWWFKNNMNLKPRDPILIQDDLVPEDQEPPKETPRFEEVALNEVATVKALVSLQKEFEDKQLNIITFKDRLALEFEYRENQEKIVREEIKIEKYMQQQKNGVNGPGAIERESLNENFIIIKTKK